MGFYGDVVLPFLLDRAMRNEDLVPYRRRVIGCARGRVLEIGIGSGLNLPFYGPAATEIIGIEPSRRLVALASRQPRAPGMRVTFLQRSAEDIPLDTADVDTVVTTWTLCSIPDAATALSEIRRVLKPGGCLLFVEHGRAPDRGVARLQNWLTPAWKPIAGGCHLNRPIADLISRSGFRISELRTGYAPGPRPFTYMYEGAALAR
jgi:ubiquinone/menaquinone biosynthesis C-methylase UbiE